MTHTILNVISKYIANTNQHLCMAWENISKNIIKLLLLLFFFGGGGGGWQEASFSSLDATVLSEKN